MTTVKAASAIPLRRGVVGGAVLLVYVFALAASATIAVLQSHGPALVTASRFLQVDMAATSPLQPGLAHLKVQPKPLLSPARTRAHVIRATPPTAFAPKATRPELSRSANRAPVAANQPGLVIRIAVVSTPADMQAAINSCEGPVEIVWGDFPTEIAQHDYCGGAVFQSLTAGQAVQVIGGGLSGTYIVNGNRRVVAGGASADQLAGLGDIVLQTCVSDGAVLVGLDPVG